MAPACLPSRIMEIWEFLGRFARLIGISRQVLGVGLSLIGSFPVRFTETHLSHIDWRKKKKTILKWTARRFCSKPLFFHSFVIY